MALAPALACALGACVAGVGEDPSVGSVSEALTRSRVTADHPYVGLLEYKKSSSTYRCTGTLVGARTVLASASCLSGSYTNFRFRLNANGMWYDARNPIRPVSYPSYEWVSVDFGYGAANVRIVTDDYGIIQLTSIPDLSIGRASIADEVPDMSPSDDYEVLGTESDGDVVVTLHDNIDHLHPKTMWFQEQSGSSSRGGLADTRDSTASRDRGGPTMGVIDGGWFSTDTFAVTGIHSTTVNGTSTIPRTMMIDTRVDAWANAIQGIADDDVCVDGDYEGNVDGVSCNAGPSGPLGFCGNGDIDAGEGCDDDNVLSGDGCSASCQVESGYTCSGWPSVCDDGVAECGNGELEGREECDDDNTRDGDGCSSRCEEEPGYDCRFEPSECRLDDGEAECGNGRVEGGEECDDDNLDTGDGCDDYCEIEPGYSCSRSEPSSCTEDDRFAECGDGYVDRGEDCDDGNRRAGDGCDGICREEAGWRCSGERPSECERVGGAGSSGSCGDGYVDLGSEQCDDGDRDDDDGCSASCRIEVGWTCRPTQPSDCIYDGSGAPTTDGGYTSTGCSVSQGLRRRDGSSLWLLVPALALVYRRRRRR